MSISFYGNISFTIIRIFSEYNIRTVSSVEGFMKENSISYHVDQAS